MGCFLGNKGAHDGQNDILWVHTIAVERFVRLHHVATIDEFDRVDCFDGMLFLHPFFDHDKDAADGSVGGERELELLLLVRECLRMENARESDGLESEAIGDRRSCGNGGFFLDVSDHHVAGIRVAELVDRVGLAFFVDDFAQIMVCRLQLCVAKERIGL